jgi:hypothetical protein
VERESMSQRGFLLLCGASGNVCSQVCLSRVEQMSSYLSPSEARNIFEPVFRMRSSII